ncbi:MULTISPECIES: hypothetical protein [unclassified Sporosarcina]|uniref:hypothetical protein n=1 Tax=unclassified Sporosarcina TaxID=2647733 RepID=UPI00203B64F4|nr:MULTISPECIES: hypothetical protein [unclassified Sporosarcina]GKV65869.1 hypothetical protein NCCP2331_20220 [Sporosarcina sp. NCCP-2331]GLB55994.1 hypothetical protein NCCP2378_17810 [Sporosarcina sp. NCCP-2378]
MNEELLKKILSELGGIKQDIVEMKQDIQGMKQDIAGMKQDIQNLQDEQSQIKQAVLETNEYVKDLSEKQTSQHAIITVLSSRSIEHEALLKHVH